MMSKKAGFFQFWEFLKFTILALAIVIPVRLWIAQPFIVSGESMLPNFHNGDYLIVDEITYKMRAPQKEEVIVFRYPLQPSKYFIKRIEGLPGETVKINGRDVVLADDEYYVLGDNRSNSSDSRVWGPLPKNLIIGRALVRLLPVNNINILPGSGDFKINNPSTSL